MSDTPNLYARCPNCGSLYEIIDGGKPDRVDLLGIPTVVCAGECVVEPVLDADDLAGLAEWAKVDETPNE